MSIRVGLIKACCMCSCAGIVGGGAVHVAEHQAPVVHYIKHHIPFRHHVVHKVAKKVVKKAPRREWTKADIRTMESMAKKRAKAPEIAKALSRTTGSVRQKAFALELSLNSRAPKPKKAAPKKKVAKRPVIVAPVAA